MFGGHGRWSRRSRAEADGDLAVKTPKPICVGRCNVAFQRGYSPNAEKQNGRHKLRLLPFFPFLFIATSLVLVDDRRKPRTSIFLPGFPWDLTQINRTQLGLVVKSH